ncbi:unnamed protein product [Hymenolepis diminuta]|uniref:Uncharacterized protein n=1 Tax=Hymenolepis diminuta TaxID=6216 RepID=A0A564YDF3_HYMDI|nr:unnamed protein product [Hymenolepis diminuta]
MGNAYIVVYLIYFFRFFLYSLDIVEKDHFITVLGKLEELANSENPIYVKDGVKGGRYEEDRLLLDEKAKKRKIMVKLRKDIIRFRKWFRKLFVEEEYNPMIINGEQS